MAKMAKKSQTDFTKGGRDISNTAVPLYQDALRDINDYNANTQGYIDDYLSKYYTNTAEQNDFMREYNRAMANKTAQNYSATGGGYASAGQRAYDDLQRYQDDLANRIYSGNVANAANMANQYYQNLLSSTNAYDRAYLQGKAYSDVQQYNDIADQNNSWTNQVVGALPAVGSALSFINPVAGLVGRAVGEGLNSAFGVDTSAALGQMGAGSGQSAGSGSSPWSNLANILYEQGKQFNTPKQTTNQ